MSFRKKIIPPVIRKRFAKKAVGSAPGTLTLVGEKKLDEISIEIHDYSVNHLTIKKVKSAEECKPFSDTPNPTWIQVKGLHDIETLKELWTEFNFHMLIQEDILNTNQRPKVEDYSDQIFMVFKMIYFENGRLEQEQVSVVLSEKFIFSFQESERPIMLPIKNRLAVENTRMRKGAADYMAYALMDIIIDYYFEAVETINEKLEDTEAALLNETNQSQLRSIHQLRRELIHFRKSVWPLRDSLNSLLRDENPLIKTETKLFIRDSYDHIVQVVDNLDNSREMVMSLHEMYMSGISNKMNEIMKVLTIISTIFIPLTFIAGIYGMNFENMPELSTTWGYPIVWALMLIITSGMIYFFKNKDWF